ncbi:MAG: SLBB domain-containing protein, partial [Candidatus Latescibacterota bacterium]
GLVRKPGRYELLAGMTLDDLIVLAGGLQDSAYLAEAEVARFDPRAMAAEQPVQVLRVPVSDRYELGQRPASGFLLQDMDAVSVRRNPAAEPRQFVTLQGEVRFPGRYALVSRAERLSDLLGRAGGLTEYAYPAGAKFQRAGLGRIAVDLKQALRDPAGAQDIVLVDGDVVAVPRRPATVEVAGEVFAPGAVPFRSGEGPAYYLRRVGGLKTTADEGRIYVELPNGGAMKPGRFLWLWRRWPDISPGSRIVVPAGNGRR